MADYLDRTIDFYIFNDYYINMTMFASADVSIRCCDSATITSIQTTSSVEFQLGIGPDTEWTWDEFMFSESCCIVDTYDVTCDGPYLDATLPDTPANHANAFG